MSEYQVSANRRRDFRGTKGDPETGKQRAGKKMREIEIWFRYKEGVKDILGLFPHHFVWNRWKKYTSLSKAEQAMRHLTASSYHGKYYEFEIRG